MAKEGAENLSYAERLQRLKSEIELQRDSERERLEEQQREALRQEYKELQDVISALEDSIQDATSTLAEIPDSQSFERLRLEMEHLRQEMEREREEKTAALQRHPIYIENLNREEQQRIQQICAQIEQAKSFKAALNTFHNIVTAFRKLKLASGQPIIDVLKARYETDRTDAESAAWTRHFLDCWEKAEFYCEEDGMSRNEEFVEMTEETRKAAAELAALTEEVADSCQFLSGQPDLKLVAEQLWVWAIRARMLGFEFDVPSPEWEKAVRNHFGLMGQLSREWNTPEYIKALDRKWDPNYKELERELQKHTDLLETRRQELWSGGVADEYSAMNEEVDEERCAELERLREAQAESRREASERFENALEPVTPGEFKAYEEVRQAIIQAVRDNLPLGEIVDATQRWHEDVLMDSSSDLNRLKHLVRRGRNETNLHTHKPTFARLAAAMRGKVVSLIGAVPVATTLDRLRKLLPEVEVEWPEVSSNMRSAKDLDSLCQRIRNGTVGLVVELVGYAGHNIDCKVGDACEEAGVPLVRVKRGYGLTQMAKAIEEQRPDLVS